MSVKTNEWCSGDGDLVRVGVHPHHECALTRVVLVADRYVTSPVPALGFGERCDGARPPGAGRAEPEDACHIASGPPPAPHGEDGHDQTGGSGDDSAEPEENDLGPLPSVPSVVLE